MPVILRYTDPSGQVTDKLIPKSKRVKIFITREPFVRRLFVYINVDSPECTIELERSNPGMPILVEGQPIHNNCTLPANVEFSVNNTTFKILSVSAETCGDPSKSHPSCEACDSCRGFRKSSGVVRPMTEWSTNKISIWKDWNLCQMCWKFTADLYPNLYRTTLQIDKGGLGTVYKALALKKVPAEQEIVAIKVLHAGASTDKESLARFNREAKILRELNSKHIVKCFERASILGEEIIVMEYVAGITVETLLESISTISINQIVRLGCQMLEALHMAHKNTARIIHRDIHPKNVMLSEDSLGEFQVKLVDFGLAWMFDKRLKTKDGTIMGRPKFMAPEQAYDLKKGTPYSDLYSAGAILYYLLTRGKFAYNFPDDRAGQYDILKEASIEPVSIRDITRNPGIDLRLGDIIDKVLAKDPTGAQIEFSIGSGL